MPDIKYVFNILYKIYIFFRKVILSQKLLLHDMKFINFIIPLAFLYYIFNIKKIEFLIFLKEEFIPIGQNIFRELHF
jgi:hypothetical protein